MKNFPVRNQVYTVAQIAGLELRDSAFLEFYYRDEKVCVQTCHIACDMSEVEGWADLRFTFLRETEEWIPLFRVVEEDTQKLIDLCDIEPEIEFDGQELPDKYWVVPKAFPRGQYYAKK